MAESCDPATTVSDVARRHGINRNQLFSWRRQAREQACSGEPPAAPVAAATSRPAVSGVAAPMIEVVIGRVLVRVRSHVDLTVLQQVLQMVRGLE